MSNEFVIDKRLARRSFERAAATYDQAAVVQREVCDRMFGRLQFIKYVPDFILDAGSGTGYGSRKLYKAYPGASLVALDISLKMLEKARGPWWMHSLPFLGRGSTCHVCGDFEQLPLKSSSVGMVWSNLTLQWCNDLNRVFAEVFRVLQPEGLFMFSTFGPDTLKELRQAFSGADSYTHVNRFIDMHDIGDALVRSGFVTPVMDMEMITMTYGDALGVMRDLKAIGAHNVNKGKRQGLSGKSTWQRAVNNYEKFRRDGLLPATFEVIYGHAWKPQSRQSPTGRPLIEIKPEKRS